MSGLSAEEIAQFSEEGVLGPYRHPLVAQGNPFTQNLLAAIQRVRPRLAHPGNPPHVVLPKRLASGMTWFKSSHTILPEIWDVVEHPAILERVTSLIGPDVMWWGTQIVQKGPGDIHGWHYDTEFDLHDGVLVWLGLDGDVARSSLKAITRMHHQHQAPVAFAGGVFGETVSGQGILEDARAVYEVARRLDPQARLLEPALEAGDFLICHGKTWHGSIHQGTQPRTAVTFMFARPDADIRIALSFDAKPIWHTERPTCVLLRGDARGGALNPLMTSRPPAT
jgi:hypothetical protein